MSVIIPALNEAAYIGQTLERLWRGAADEVIVADGGSADATREIASKLARVVESPRGRAVQQNHGAAAASGDVLFFLHADCWPEPGWKAEVQSAAQRNGFVAGAFRMRIDGDRHIYRCIERAGDLRVRWFGLPYGDQGIFLRSDLFRELGAFPAVSLMEDLMLMRRVRKLGRVALLDHPIHISPRRWERFGVVRQTMRNWGLTVLAVWADVHPDRLARFYPHVT